MAIKPYTVFWEVEPLQMQPFNWAKKEVETPAATHENNGIKANPTESKLQLTNAPQTCKFVTIEAESTKEALEAVGQYLNTGVNKTSGSAALAGTPQGVGGGGGISNKGLACVTSELKEESIYP